MRLTLVPTLLVLATAVVAADLDPAGFNPAPEMAPGPKIAVGQSRTVVIKGLMDFDAVNRGKYLSGSKEVSDHAGFSNLRAELGTKVRIDDSVAVHTTVAYDARAGDNTADDPEQKNRNGFVVMDDAYVEFRDFLGFDTFSTTIGRQPVRWNLRDQHGAFLYDSSANDPRVTSWDGARAGWNVTDGVDVTPFVYGVPGASTLFGGALDWKPSASGDNRLFVSYMFTWERRAPNRYVAAYNADDSAANGPYSQDSTLVQRESSPGDKLLTHYLGTEAALGPVDLYVEGALQQGDDTDSISYAGYGGQLGFDWHLYAPQALVVGLEVGHLSGNRDNPQTSGKQRAFINNWEGVSDALIVEHERYGELSNLLTEDTRDASGNLRTWRPGMQSLKLTAGIAFDDRNKVRLNALYGFFRSAQLIPNASSKTFGHEADLVFTWDYTWNVRFSLFAAGMLPRGAFKATAPVGGADPALNLEPSDSIIYLFGGNLGVAF